MTDTGFGKKTEEPLHDCTRPKPEPTLVDARTGTVEPKREGNYYFTRNNHGFVGKPAR